MRAALPSRLAATLAALAALAPAPASAAEERPSEDELFGAPPAAEASPRPVAPQAEQESREGERGEAEAAEAELFGSSGSPAAVPPPPEPLVSRERDDPLRVGGQLYLRGATSWTDGTGVDDWALSSPNLLDVFLDVRSNDRVRGFALARMSYDPTLDGQREDAVDLVALPPAGEPLPLPEVLRAFSRGATPDNPDVLLDQLWVNFDVARRAFVTVGRQHVKWGVGRFWNPTDWLHSARRDPLAVFDPRTGTTMVKVHVPWEARGWNAYGYLVLDDTGPRPVATSRLGRVGAAARTEVVLGTVELGLDALVRDGRRPRFGADVSFGVWELDLYAEAALRSGADVERWTRDASEPLNFGLRRIEHDGLTPQVVVGGSWSARYSDEDVVTVGAEYFYDDTGYDGAEIYPALLAVPFAFEGEPSPFLPAYLGKHQAGVFATLPSPGSWNDHTFTLSALANVSDGSVIVRLDHSLLALTYLRVETYVAGHLGTRGGEHRFALDLDVTPTNIPALRLTETIRIQQPPPVLDFGIAVRVSL